MRHSRKSHRENFRSDNGFTLIELLTVIAIIGILAAFSLPAISKIRARARVGAAKEQLRHIETALEEYYAEHDSYPPLGNDWVGGVFFPSEDVGTDGIGPFKWDSGAWVPNGAYEGPDANGTEGNYRLDENEDKPTTGFPSNWARNGVLDGTYYSKLGMFADADTQKLIDIFAADTYYHYYPGYVYGNTTYGMPKFKEYSGLQNYKQNAPAFYNRYVIYSVGPDGNDHGLHNYYLVMQDGEDVGTDAFASDPADQDDDKILFEPSTEENDNINSDFTSVTVLATGWTTPGVGSEMGSPAGNNSIMDGPRGKPVFSYDVRMERRGKNELFVTPDGDGAASGVIMRYGP